MIIFKTFFINIRERGLNEEDFLHFTENFDSENFKYFRIDEIDI